MNKVVKEKVIAQKGSLMQDTESRTRVVHICLHALYSMLPKIYALAHGADVICDRDEAGNRVARHACPIGANPVIFELSRE